MTGDTWIVVVLCAVIVCLLFLHLRLESRVAGIEWRARGVRHQLERLEDEQASQRLSRSLRRQRRRR